ncbi:MAG: methyltransferase domain-containing protein [Acidimicrobiales bacterium]
MLTVDYDKLDLQPGMVILDMGCGAGRHAFESFRRGARVVALDYSFDELAGVRDLLWAMRDAGEVPESYEAQAVRGDALCLPFADNTFDRIICSEVMEHLQDDTGAIAELTRVLKPGGIIAVTVPAWLPEKICWTLSAEYHAPLSPGGHVRIYTESQIRERMAGAGLELGDSHRAHALHSPYWWLRCAISPTNDTHPMVRKYHDLLVWDMVKAPKVTRVAERVLNPIIGKSVVVYGTKPAPARASGRRSARVAA